MLLVAILSVLFVGGNCKGHGNDHHRNGERRQSHSQRQRSDEGSESHEYETNGNSGTFYVDAIKNIGFLGKPDTYQEDGDYKFDIGNTVELTCKQHVKTKKSLTLQWIDSNGFETESRQDFRDNKIRIRMTPDGDDVGMTFTCRAFGPLEEKTISIKLTVESGSSLEMDKDVKSELIFLKTGATYTTNANCNGTVEYPKATNLSRSKVSVNTTIIKNFNEKYNGTNLTCITYKNMGSQDSVSRLYLQNSVKSTAETHVRLKRKYTLYGAQETERFLVPTEKETRGSLNENGGKAEEELTETGGKTEGVVTQNIEDTRNIDQVKHTDSSSPVAVVGGVLGAIIALLMTIIAVIWYKKIRPSYTDGAANQVIYAEIEEMSPRVPPPRRIETPYASILGSLVPKNQVQPSAENMYCVVK